MKKFWVITNVDIEPYGFTYVRTITTNRKAGMYLFKNNGRLRELKDRNILYIETNRYFI